MTKPSNNSLFHEIANSLSISMIKSSYSSLFHEVVNTLCNTLFKIFIPFYVLKKLSVPKLLEVIFNLLMTIINSCKITFKSFYAMIKSHRITIKSCRIAIESFLTITKLSLGMIKISCRDIFNSFLAIINPCSFKFNFTSPFLVFIICIFISFSCLKLYCYSYSLPLISFCLFSFNAHYGTLFLIFLNMIIFEFSKRSDHLWISTKQMSIPTIILTLFFVLNSISDFGKSLKGSSPGDLKGVSSLLGSFSNNIDMLVFIGILFFICILLHQYSKIFSPLFLYIILFLIVLVLSYIVIGSISIDADTARSEISTIIQGEAAIFALVFSLSLVVMQQTASSYPPDVSKFFYKRNLILYSTVVIYVVSIIFGVSVLIQPLPPEDFFEIGQGPIWFTFLFGIFALLSIFPFVKNTFNFLSPHKLIELIGNNRKSDISSIESKDCIRILGILLVSLKKSDYDAVETGLDYLEEHKKEFIDFQKNIVVPLNSDIRIKLEKPLYCLAHYFVDVGELSLKVGSTDDCTIKVIKNFYDIRKVADEYEMECITSLTTESIGKLAKKTVCPLKYMLNDVNPDNRECASFALELAKQLSMTEEELLSISRTKFFTNLK